MEEDYRRYGEVPDIKINIQDVVDFSFCPQYYKFKNEDKTVNVVDLYNKAIKKVFYKYLYKMMDEKVLDSSIGTLKYYWGKEWIKEKTNSKIMIETSAKVNSAYDTKRQQGITAIINFEKMINNVKQTALVVNKEWEVHIAQNVYLTGKWEYIREIDTENGPVIQIITFDANDNMNTTNMMYSHDLVSTASQYAFDQEFNNINNQFLFMDVYRCKIKPSIRTNRDFDLLKRTVMSVALCLMNGIECISPDKKCFYCEYRNKCMINIGS